MSGLNVDITADTRQFQAEVENLPATLSKISEELNATTKAGDAAGTSIESGMRVAQEQTAQSEKVFKDYTNTVVRGTQKQTEAYGLSNREINSIQKESLRTSAKSLALQVEQSATALDGTVNGAVSAIQNIGIGVAALGTGPIVGVALAGVTAFGLIQGAIGQAQQSEKDLQANIQGLIKDLQSTGSEGSASLGYIVDQLKKLEDGSAANGRNLAQVKAEAKAAGVDFKDYAEAIAGGTTQLDKQIAAAKAKQLAERAALQEAKGGYAQHGAIVGQDASLQSQATATILANLENEKKAVEAAAQAQKDAAAAGLPEYERKLNLIGQVDAAYSSAAGGVNDFVDAETGVFDTAKYITSMEQRAKALDDYKANLASSALSGPAKDFLESQGEQAAATLLQGYVAATPAQKAELQNIWTTAGEASANSFTSSFAAGVQGKTPPTVVVPVVANTASFDKALAELQKKTITIGVDARLYGRVGP